MERFYVATTTGYLTASTDGNAGKQRPGVTAMVLDRSNMYRPAFLVRSEDVRTRMGQTRQALALSQAEEASAALNAGAPIPDCCRPGRLHGTIGRYRYGLCRCDRCRAAKARVERAYQARRRARAA